MKKVTLLLILAFGIYFSHAQNKNNNDQIQTIFSKDKSNGAYGAFTFAYSQIDGKDAFISGGRLAFIFDHSLAIGAGGYGFVNNLDYHSYYGNYPLGYSLAGGYGGIFIEPIVGGTKPVHVSFPVLLGAGGVALIENYGWQYWEGYPFNDMDHDAFFVIEPAVELELNLTRWFRAAAALSYRYTSNIELYQTDADVLRGLNFGLTCKFGKF
jgi:hypothetical protein